MGRKVYTTPMTNLYQVELEGAFASSIVNKEDSEVRSTGHEIEDDIPLDTFEWNNGSWE